MDLDIGWGHRLFGFDDQSDLIAGATVRWLGMGRMGMGNALVGFLGMELLGPLAVGFRNVDAFFWGGKKKREFLKKWGWFQI